LPALFVLSPTSPTALRTASTFELFREDPFERLLWLLVPLLELRDLPPADFALAFGVFGFDDDLARLGADRFFALVFV